MDDLVMEATHLRDYLRTALQMLKEARCPFAVSGPSGEEWIKNRDAFIAAVEFEHFGGPDPGGEEHPY